MNACEDLMLLMISIDSMILYVLKIQLQSYEEELVNLADLIGDIKSNTGLLDIEKWNVSLSIFWPVAFNR